MFDIFYIGKKPNLFLHEREVKSFKEAKELSNTRLFWLVHYLCDYTGFDFLWEPKPWEAHQRHAFPSQHQKDSGTSLCPKEGWTETNYRTDTVLRLADTTYWTNIVNYQDFDISWHPDPNEPEAYVYKFCTQWQKTGGPVYTVPGATTIKYISEQAVIKETIDNNWVTKEPFPDFDFTWHPDDTEEPYIYKFGTQWQKTGGPTYVVPGSTITKFVNAPRFNKTEIDDNWKVPEDAEFKGFDYTWHPDATEPPMEYQFGDQWQKTGGPLYVQKGAEAIKYVTQERVENIAVSVEVYLIDHGNPEIQTVIEQLESKGVTIKKRARFISSYKGTLERILSKEEKEFVWVCSSVCDYSDFDFSWHPEQWQGTMLHVFPSNNEKFGDTFLVNTVSFNNRIKSTELLEWYDTIHFVDNIVVPRWPMPVVHVGTSSLVEPVREHVFKEPVTLFTDNNNLKNIDLPVVNLWREKTRVIMPLSTGSNTVIVPRDAKTHLNVELYDYANIDTICSGMIIDKPLDIVFISNGEENADKNWKHLERCLAGKDNRRIRVDGVKGRAQAYQAAANASNTEWFFAVFAKLTVDKDFDWTWQPDRMQQNKHYIFHAKNPVNGLVYGHMAMIAYQKELVLNTNPTGLDFTLDSEHEVVPILSGVANYADDIWTAWRSAFREVIKLQDAVMKTKDIEAEYRLKEWLTKGAGEIGQWSRQGALDAVQYYTDVNGDFEHLRLSYEWDFLLDYYKYKYEK